MAGVLIATGCAPPSLRNAHSLDKGELPVSASGTIDQTDLQAEFYTLEDNQTVSSAAASSESLDGDITLSVGLGKGFELGATTFGMHAKYSALDERRHPNAPLSIALATEFGWRYGGFGLLFSRHLDLGAIALRPVANVWFQSHTAPQSWALPESSVIETLDVVNPGAEGGSADGNNETVSGVLTAKVNITELALPVGIEVPLSVSDQWDIVPFAAYALTLPVDVSYRGLSCADCLAGLGDVTLLRRSFLWAGIKIQPSLRRPGAGPAATAASESEDQP